jgi:lipoprotein-releasing system permease protein
LSRKFYNILNLEYFIAKRLASTPNDKSTISAPITKIAITAIALGIVMMIIAVATGVGLQHKIRDKVSAFNGQIIISSFTGNESDVSTEPINLNQKFYPKFKTVSGINHIQAVITKAGMIRTETAFEGIIFKGVGKDFLWKNIKDFIVKGTIPNVNNQLNNEVVISQFLANRLKLNVGSSFNTFFIKENENKLPNSRRFKVVGIYNSGFQEFDATYVIGDIRHLQKINKWNENQIGSFEVFVNDFSKIEQKEQEIYNEIGATLNAKSIVNKYYYIFDWLKLFDFNILIIIIVMIAVSVINIIVALLVLILEKVQTIGILKSLGANNSVIRKIFIYNVFHLILKGLLIGNVIGISLLFIQKYFKVITLNPENYYVTTAPVEINPLHILGINLITILISFLFLIIPSIIITKISPAKNIKFQ